MPPAKAPWRPSPEHRKIASTLDATWLKGIFSAMDSPAPHLATTNPASVPAPASAATSHWYVLHTRSRQEKLVAETLASLQIRYVLPLVKKNAYYGRRKVESELPLFPGYVFMHGELDQVYTADRTKRIANIIHVRNEQKLEEELFSLEQALANSESFDPFPYLTKGVAVEVRSGPLQGVRGLIEDRAKRNRLILQVEILGQATSIEVDGSLLDVVE